MEKNKYLAISALGFFLTGCAGMSQESSCTGRLLLPVEWVEQPVERGSRTMCRCKHRKGAAHRLSERRFALRRSCVFNCAGAETTTATTATTTTTTTATTTATAATKTGATATSATTTGAEGRADDHPG